MLKKRAGRSRTFIHPHTILLDESLNCQFHQVTPEMKTMQQVDRYKVSFVNDLFAPRNTRLSSYLPEKKAFVVISEAAHVIFGKKIKTYLRRNGIEHRYYVYAGGENKKYWFSVMDIVRQLLMERDSHEVLMSIGGGTTMDLWDLLLRLHREDILGSPTTLLGIIDAGIGVKVGCNFQGSKNFLGTFMPP